MRTQGKPLPLRLERQTVEYRSHDLPEQRLSAETSMGTSARVGKHDSN